MRCASTPRHAALHPAGRDRRSRARSIASVGGDAQLPGSTPTASASRPSAIGTRRRSAPRRGAWHLSLVPRRPSRLRAAPTSIAPRTAMAEAALCSGLAISQTRTALAHSMSYPITAHFGVPHGLACALALPAVLAFNLETDDGRLADVAARPDSMVLTPWCQRCSTCMASSALPMRSDRACRTSVRSGHSCRRCSLPGRADNNLRPADQADVAEILAVTDGWFQRRARAREPARGRPSFANSGRSRRSRAQDPAFRETRLLLGGRGRLATPRAGDPRRSSPITTRTSSYLSSDPDDPGLAHRASPVPCLRDRLGDDRARSSSLGWIAGTSS